MDKDLLIHKLIICGACDEAIDYVMKHPSEDFQTIYLECPDPNWWHWIFYKFGYFLDVCDLIQDHINEMMESVWQQYWYEQYSIMRAEVKDHYRRTLEEVNQQRCALLDSCSSEHDKYYYDVYVPARDEALFVADLHQKQLDEEYDKQLAPFLLETAQKIIASGILPDWRRVRSMLSDG
jgi:hypothetical protein